MLERLRAVFDPERAGDGLFECRHCGTVVGSDETSCHACGSEEIARYDL